MTKRIAPFALTVVALGACHEASRPGPEAPTSVTAGAYPTGADARLGAASTSTTVIGFDALPEGTQVTNQFAGQGISFSSDAYGGRGPQVDCVEAFRPPSLPNALTVGGADGGCSASRVEGPYTFTFTFSPAVCSLSLVAIIREGTQSLVALDAAGNVLATDTKVMSGGGTTYAVSAAAGISSATFSKTSGDPGLTGVIDDVTFGPCSPPNQPPYADAGSDQTVFVGEAVTLDGSASGDPDGDALAFRWHLDARPAGSAAVLVDVSAVRPTLVPDLAGAYSLQLVVNDGHVDSQPDDVIITAQTLAEATEEVVDAVGDLVAIGALRPGQGKALATTLKAAIRLLDLGNVQAAVAQLQAFIKQVQSYIRARILTSEQGQRLIDAVRQLIAHAGG